MIRIGIHISLKFTPMSMTSFTWINSVVLLCIIVTHVVQPKMIYNTYRTHVVQSTCAIAITMLKKDTNEPNDDTIISQMNIIVNNSTVICPAFNVSYR